MNPFLGQILMFGGNFAPRGWALCDGQLLSINENQALFAILGTTYGGDGRTTFKLPDLRGRAPMHAGSGPGLTPRRLGSMGGSEFNVLNVTQIPPHNHSATGTMRVHNDSGDNDSAEGHVLATAESDIYSTVAPSVNMRADNVSVTVGNTGGGQAVNNVQPFQCVNYIIALQGTFPSRN